MQPPAASDGQIGTQKWDVPGWNLWTDGDKMKWSQSSGAAPSAHAAPVEVKKEEWDDGYSDYYNKNYHKDYNNKGMDWKKADEEMKPVPNKRELAPPPPPRPAPRQTQPPLPTGPRPATVQPQAKAMPTPEQIAAKAKAKSAARNLKLRESITRQMAEENAAMLERIVANGEAAEGDEE